MVRRMSRLLPVVAVPLTAAMLLAGCGSESNSGDSASGKSTTSTEQQGPEEQEPEAVSPQPFNVSGLLNGNAKPNLPAGEPGKVSVIAQAPLEKDDIGMGSAELTFAFRNNTEDAISHVDWTATARAGGKIVATGSSQGTQPAQIAPGEVGMAFIYFETGEKIPDNGATYEFSAETSEADTESYNTAPLVVGEANRTGNAIVGEATNETGEPVVGPYGAEVYCFAGNKLVGRTGSFAEEDGDVAPDGTVHFTVDLFDTSCKSFAIGVSGYFA